MSVVGLVLSQLLNSELITANVEDRLRILHVDDDQSILEISKQILMDMGSFDIDLACCVDGAFRKLVTGKRGDNLRPKNPRINCWEMYR
jgi:hypothetical protein